eukprot:gene14959-17686_t
MHHSSCSKVMVYSPSRLTIQLTAESRIWTKLPESITELCYDVGSFGPIKSMFFLKDLRGETDGRNKNNCRATSHGDSLYSCLRSARFLKT